LGDTRLEQDKETSGNHATGAHGGAESGALGAREALIDPSLVTVVEAWPKLPEVIKVEILAMIRAARLPES
jgi:hypothetical protein